MLTALNESLEKVRTQANELRAADLKDIKATLGKIGLLKTAKRSVLPAYSARLGTL